ncbi:MAG: type II toxin-antitoxin system RelE/ParE family toxin [Spirochaetes bacterium]|nr:type II toxin-antitoxin system RelE/ParE family toxin [Spirochaetota bacterium]
MNLVYHPEAVNEIESSIDYYNELQDGLGFKFYYELLRSIDLIKEYPKTWPIYYKKTRRILVNNFPYALIYLVTENKIVILAAMNCYRKPGYWKKRL